MFFLLLQKPFQNLTNRVRRLRKRGCTDRKKIENDYLVKKFFMRFMKLIKELGFLNKVKLISETEKADIMKYLKEAYFLNYNFASYFARECVPHQLTEEDLIYLDECTERLLEETDGPL